MKSFPALARRTRPFPPDGRVEKRQHLEETRARTGVGATERQELL